MIMHNVHMVFPLKSKAYVQITGNKGANYSWVCPFGYNIIIEFESINGPDNSELFISFIDKNVLQKIETRFCLWTM